MTTQEHVQALLEAPTVPLAAAWNAIKKELERRKDCAAHDVPHRFCVRDHVTLRPE